MRPTTVVLGYVVLVFGLVGGTTLLQPDVPGEAPPGSPRTAFDPAIQRELFAVPVAEAPRARHVAEDGSPVYRNRLLLERSPYLRQHAFNPVNWFPWGDEAFAMAERLGRPIFLSVGYATCHWCHVMEEESFEDPEIAAFLNAHFVAVKVDREERPDVDAVYMEAVRVANRGRGGWPMSVWLTSDGEPFHAKTYLPPRDGMRGRKVGFLTVLQELARAWEEERDGVELDAAALTLRIRRLGEQDPGVGVPREEVLSDLQDRIVNQADPVRGGVARAPKFPSQVPVRAMLRAGPSPEARAVVRRTLDAMDAGGIHDQLGGGFHRYTVDREWTVPHFEKMLYDQARMVLDYTEGAVVFGNDRDQEVVASTIEFAHRELELEDGLLASALDADSLDPDGERVEGWFYTWTSAEIRSLLPDGPHPRSLGVIPEGHVDGRSVLHRGLGHPPFEPEVVDTLLDERRTRPRPLRDDKAVVGWNGWWIAAEATAGRLFWQDEWVTRAASMGEALLKARDRHGHWPRTVVDGVPGGTAFLPDLAFVCQGFLRLYEATGDPSWLEEAQAIDEVLAADFEDPSGGFFLTPGDGESLLLRDKPFSDGAEPSGNSIHAANLLDLYAFTGHSGYLERAESLLTAVSYAVDRRPTSHGELLLAVDRWYDPPLEIVLLGEGGPSRAMLSVANSHADLNHVLLPVDVAKQAEHEAVAPIVSGKALLGGPTAYVCQGGVCQQPVTDPEALRAQLQSF